MNGLLLRNVRATLCIDGEAVREEFGELGFSERGIEGAVALRMSRDAVDALIDGKGVGLMVDLKPGLTEEMLRERIAREMAEMGPEEFFSELLRKLVPKALVIPLSEEVGAHSKNYIRKITPEQIEQLVKLLKGMVFPISDYAPFEYAVVTAGGVSCEDVNRYTMESLKVKGLYFAGEVLDLDANTGGYNLQIAFRPVVWPVCSNSETDRTQSTPPPSRYFPADRPALPGPSFPGARRALAIRLRTCARSVYVS